MVDNTDKKKIIYKIILKIMAKDKKEIVSVASAELLAQLGGEFPADAGFNRIMLPRLALVSQDVMEGKGKAMKVVTEAGTFYTEVQSENEVKGDDGKMYKLWEKTEIGNEIEAIVLFQRKQLRFYDSNAEVYTSSPIYDSVDEVVPLFCQKAEVARGTPAELQARKEFQGVTAAGKPTSKLEENKILYVLYEGEVYQMSLRGTSMYAFKTYAKTTMPNTVVTIFNSEPKEKGTTKWNQMTFKAKRSLSTAEAKDAIAKIAEIKAAIVGEKSQYAAAAPRSSGNAAVDKEVNNF